MKHHKGRAVDITPQDDTTTTQPISDDQELAKALAGISQETEQPLAVAPLAPTEEEPVEMAEPPMMAVPTLPPVQAMPDPMAVPQSVPSSGLDSIKQTALQELRPLIDRVDLPADEKFDTYLMLIRSTDDTSLIEPAHAAAQAITDEKKKAEALLDIIKEIDFLSHPQA
jgi:hypothetical protein